MKAIILAGGSGTRLRPLTAEVPKPMVTLMGRPLLEHIFLLLWRSGITEAAVTLHYLPEVVEHYFGDGSEWGMRLSYFQEREPLGTAGAVKACEDFLGEDEDVLVLSGDALCDFDLREAIRFHRQRRCAATLLLCRSEQPLEYGLVRTEPDGTITEFVEKPGWGQVFTDQVNTGIYLLSRRALAQIPENTVYDFGRDLFPRLLERGETLCGFLPEGYWKDIGDCGAYLQAVQDALEEKVRLDMGMPQETPGIWCASPVPETAKLLPPCYIEKNVSIGAHSVIGPFTVLERGSRVGARSVVRNAVLMGAALEDGVEATGAILCPEASAGSGSVLNPGTVLGSRSAAGEHAILRQGVRLWPDVKTAPGQRVSTTITAGRPGQMVFEDGILLGSVGQEISPELMVSIGSLLGEEKTVGLGFYGGVAARALTMAAAAGIASAGGTALMHDGTTAAAAAWVAGERKIPLSLFLCQQDNRIILHFFDKNGLPLTRIEQRKLESALLQGVFHRSPAEQVGQQRELSGVDGSYLREAVRRSGTGPVRPLSVLVPRQGRANVLLREALYELGMKVRSGEGPLCFSIAENGTELTARDEEGKLVSAEQMQLLTGYLLLEQGERQLVLADSAPAAAETLAGAYGAVILRMGRDRKQVSALAHEQRCLWDGVFAACLILRRMAQSGERLSRLLEKLPPCVLHREELNLHTGRSSLMQKLTARYPEAESTAEGLRIPVAGGSVFVAPRSRLSALKISAEAASAEAAEELCGLLTEQVKRLDSPSAP